MNYEPDRTEVLRRLRALNTPPLSPIKKMKRWMRQRMVVIRLTPKKS